MNPRVTRAVAAILLVHAAHAWADGAPTSEATAPELGQLAEVIVTAQRRAENIQDVPITVQALTFETLRELNVATLDDFIKFLPNVTQSTQGPAQGEIFMRGLSVGGSFGQGGGTEGFFPAVATYLDEQSGQLPSRNLDVYAADLERIEVLEGPQGTLFGGGALSGVLRYITNKPKLNVTEASFTAGYGTTAHGDPSDNVTAVINLPIIEDTLAVRGVLYNDRHGGYINNVPSTFTRSGTDLGFARYNGGVVPTNSLSINNDNLVGDAINPLTYTGIRVEALYKINDDWDVLLTQSYQNMDSQGVFFEMPRGTEGAELTANGTPIGGQPLPPLSVNLFNPSYDKDKFENTALVVNGQIGFLKAIYSGAYLVRNVDQQTDYTNYARGVYGYYYQCAGYSTNPATGTCYTPSTIWTEEERNTHQSHELRLSTPDDKRIRGLVGVYWEDYQILDQTHYSYVTVPTCSPTGLNVNCYLPIEPWPGSPAYIPTPATGFFDDVQRTYKQLAEFTSVEFDIIPKVLTLTGGIRHFKYDEKETGGDVGSFYCKQFTPTTYFGFCQAPYGTDFAGSAAYHTTATGNRSRVNLSYHVTPDILLYGTWSQGFRPGTFNRSTSCHLPDAQGIDLFCTPASTVPDNVTNKEFGWKTMFWNHRIQFNGAIYQEDWTNVQIEFFDPESGLGNLGFSANGPNYRIRGLESSVVTRVTSGLTVQVAASWNNSSQTNSPFLDANNPALLANPASAAEYGKQITSIPNPYGPLGSPTEYSPPFKISARIRYDWVFNQYTAFVQATGDHQDHMYTATGYALGATNNIPGFSTYGASAGISRGDWSVQLFAQNLTNADAIVGRSSEQYIAEDLPIRPRVLGITVSYEFTQYK